MKTLLVIGGGVAAVQGIRRAKELGYYVVVCDANKNAPGFAIADEGGIACTYN
ncbi:MAG: phosphoribosylglycinamide synthetase, partial [Phototrophicales bacterium]